MGTVETLTRKFDSPIASKELPQLDLALGRKATPVSVPLSIIAVQPTKLAALMLCCQASGLEAKEIYGPLGIDASHWTRITKGDAYFPNNKEHALMDLCGNDIPLQWDALKRGMELRPLLSTLEQQLAAEKTARQEAERRLEIVTRFVKDTR